MTTDPSAKFNALTSKFDRLRENAGFPSITRELSDLSATVMKLPGEVGKIRTRGYAFRSYLEHKAEVLSERWDEVRQSAERTLEQEREHLRAQVRNLEQKMDMIRQAVTASPQKAESLITDMDANVTELEKRVGSGDTLVKNVYSSLRQDIQQTQSQIAEINWIMDQKEEATFPFLAGETVFLAAKAQWVTGKDDPEGMLFLTDQRLVMEQKQKVGKVLGIFGGKKVQDVSWEVHLHQVEKVEAENKGFFGGKDMLYFTLGAGAPYPKITVEVKGSANCKFWVKQIQRMSTGEVNDERAIAPDQELIESLRKAPTDCHVCGASLPMLTAGQKQIECMYCGSIIRL